MSKPIKTVFFESLTKEELKAVMLILIDNDTFGKYPLKLRDTAVLINLAEDGDYLIINATSGKQLAHCSSDPKMSKRKFLKKTTKIIFIPKLTEEEIWTLYNTVIDVFTSTENPHRRFINKPFTVEFMGKDEVIFRNVKDAKKICWTEK